MNKKEKTFNLALVNDEDKKHDPLAIETRIADEARFVWNDPARNNEMIERTYKLRLEMLGRNNPLTRDACDKLAEALHRSGRYGESADYYKELYDTCPEVDARQKIRLGQKLGVAYRFAFQPIKAVKILRLTHIKAVTYYGSDTVRQNTEAIKELAGAFYDAGNPEMATAWLEKLVAIAKTPSEDGPSRYLEACAKRMLAYICCFRLNDKDKALALCREVILIERELNGSRNTLPTGDVEYLARYHRHFLDNKKAIELFELLYAETRGSQWFGKAADDYLLDIADTNMWSNRDEAQEIYERIYETYKTKNWGEHLFLRAVEGLAECCWLDYPKSDCVKQTAVLREGYEWACRELGEHTPEALHMLFLLTQALGYPESELFDADKVTEMSEKAYRQSAELLGTLHPCTVKALTEYAYYAGEARDDYAKAVGICKETCEAAFESQGKKGPASQKLADNIARICRNALMDLKYEKDWQALSQDEQVARTVSLLVGDDSPIAEVVRKLVSERLTDGSQTKSCDT